jgi:hypothetical protein
MQKVVSAPNEVFVEDDLIYSISHKPSTLDVTKAYFVAVEPVFAKYGYAFMLTDVTRTLEVAADARRLIAEWGKTHYVVASALFGPSGSTLAMLTLITSAMKLVGKGDRNIRFFAKESEARAWLEEQRQQFYSRRLKRAEK